MTTGAITGGFRRGHALALGCAALLALSGCNTDQVLDDLRGVPRPATQTVFVETTPVDGARCTLEAAGRRVELRSTPGAVEVPFSRDALRVTCSRDGFETASRSFDNLFTTARVDAAYERNIANSNLERPTPISGYPDRVSVALRPAPVAAPAGASGGSTAPATTAPAVGPVIPTTRNPAGTPPRR